MAIAAWSCWIWGTHVAVLLPGVVAYLLVQASVQEGWAQILPTGPGRYLLALFLLSGLSAAAWMTAGWQFFRSRARRGLLHLAVAILGGLAAVGMIVVLAAWPDRVFR